MSLPSLARGARARRCSGADFVARHGKRWPLLPKTLAVAELLSVQAHPPGNTEVYVIIAADAGATIRLGFKTDVDARRVRGARRRLDAACSNVCSSCAARRSTPTHCRVC